MDPAPGGCTKPPGALETAAAAERPGGQGDVAPLRELGWGSVMYGKPCTVTLPLGRRLTCPCAGGWGEGPLAEWRGNGAVQRWATTPPCVGKGFEKGKSTARGGKTTKFVVWLFEFVEIVIRMKMKNSKEGIENLEHEIMKSVAMQCRGGLKQTFNSFISSPTLTFIFDDIMSMLKRIKESTVEKKIELKKQKMFLTTGGQDDVTHVTHVFWSLLIGFSYSVSYSYFMIPPTILDF